MLRFVLSLFLILVSIAVSMLLSLSASIWAEFSSLVFSASWVLRASIDTLDVIRVWERHVSSSRIFLE